MTDTSTWPSTLKYLASIIGAEATDRLAERFGGTQDVYIPAKPDASHPFVAVIGLDNMLKLSAVLAEREIYIPRGTFRDLKKKRILNAAPGTAKEIALEVGCTMRYVKKVRNSFQDERQNDLFGDED